METVRDFIFSGSKISADGDCNHKIKGRLFLGRKAMANLDSILKNRDITLPTKVCLVKALVFPVVVHLVIHGHKESWALENWCFWTVGLEKTLESLLDSKEIKLVNPKGNQSWILIGRTDAEVPILWPSDAKSCLIRKDLMLERLNAREEDDRGRDGWMVSLTQWTWVWASSRRWWRTGKPGMLQFMGSQRVGHYWVTEQQMQNTPPKQDHFQAIKNILKIYGDFYSKACYEFQFMVHVVLIPNNS